MRQPAMTGDQADQLGVVDDSACDTALRLNDEFEENLDLRMPSVFRLELGKRFVERELRSEEDLIGIFDSSDLIFGETVPRQPDRVEAHQLGTVTLSGAIRGNIHRHHRPPCNEGQIPDSRKLMHRGQTSESDVVADPNVPGQRCAVRQHAAVPQTAVVGHMAVGHEEIPVPDAGDSSAAFGADMQGRKLADLVVIANHQLGVLTRIFQVLRHGSYRSEVEHPISLAERGPPVDHRVSANPAFCADSNLGTDNRVGADLDRLVELRLGVYDRGGMDFTHRNRTPRIDRKSRSAMVARNSASATFTRSTEAVPLCFQIAPLCRSTSTSSCRRSPGTTGRRNFALSIAIR